jgi:hypothetical protein
VGAADSEVEASSVVGTFMGHSCIDAGEVCSEGVHTNEVGLPI